MAIDDRDIAQLDHYIQGTLDEAQSAVISQRLAAEGDFKQLYEDMSLLSQSIERDKTAEKLQLLQELEKRGTWTEAAEPPVQRKIIGLSKQNLMSIAATILLLIAAGWWYSKPSALQQELTEFYAMHETPPVDRPGWIVITRSTEKTMDGVDPALIRGYNLYEVGMYKDAAKALEDYYSQTDDQEALYYAGISYAAIGNIKKAKEYLNKTTHPKEGAFINELLTKINK